MDFNEAMAALENGANVKLPEWTGYWFRKDNQTYVLTKQGDILDTPWANRSVTERKDWEICKGLGFDWAINALKAGKTVRRKGWNGKGMFIFMRPGDALPVQTVVDHVKSLPQSVKDYYYLNGPLVPFSERKDKVSFTPYLCMKAADGTIVNGWLASQTDMLANDWELA